MKLSASIIFSFLFFTSPVMADPPEPVEKSLKLATHSSAASLVEDYYQQAAIGLSDENLDRYYTSQKLRRHDTLIQRLAYTTGQSMDIEQRRVLDIERMNAQCETLNLQNVKTFGSATKKTELRYSVTNRCVDYPPRVKRTIALFYSTGFDQWQIHQVSDSEMHE